MQSHADLPRANQNGGGIFSLPDWSCPPPGQQDRLQGLRSAWSEWLAAKRIPLRWRSHVQAASAEPLFTPAEVAELRVLAFFPGSLIRVILQSLGKFRPFSPTPGPPLHPSPMPLPMQMSLNLWPSLLEGVPTGIDADIPKSNVFIPQQGRQRQSSGESYMCARAISSKLLPSRSCWLNLWPRRLERAGSFRSRTWHPLVSAGGTG